MKDPHRVTRWVPALIVLLALASCAVCVGTAVILLWPTR